MVLLGHKESTGAIARRLDILRKLEGTSMTDLDEFTFTEFRLARIPRSQ